MTAIPQADVVILLPLGRSWTRAFSLRASDQVTKHPLDVYASAQAQFRTKAGGDLLIECECEIDYDERLVYITAPIDQSIVVTKRTGAFDAVLIHSDPDVDPYVLWPTTPVVFGPAVTVIAP